MYRTSKEYFQLLPELLSAEQATQATILSKTEDDYFAEYLKSVDIVGRKEFRNSDDYKELDVKYNITQVRKSAEELSKFVFNKFIEMSDVPAFSSVEEAFIQVVRQCHRINLWEEDVRQHKEELAAKGLDKYSTESAKNYWYFMEWRNDFINMSYPLLGMLNAKVPEALLNDEVSILEYADAMMNNCGYLEMFGKEHFLNNIEDTLKTAYDWKLQENGWILKGMENTQQKYFDEQVNFLIALYKFISNRADFSPFKDIQYYSHVFLNAEILKDKELNIATVDDAMSMLKDTIYHLIELRNNSSEIVLRIESNRDWLKKRIEDEIVSKAIALAGLIVNNSDAKMSKDNVLVEKIFEDVYANANEVYHRYRTEIKSYIEYDLSEILLMQKSELSDLQKTIWFNVQSLMSFFKDKDVEIQYENLSHLIKFTEDKTEYIKLLED